ncbi:hypothetical protein [Legionella yabuuchiae]|uniref:hypothetical protein n=1 Tax=Legionella yabuuchiae TaxID=376727 RepID=UPI0010551157|nr:hypothetical protein [Legionella yabuuchiae]
MKINFTKKEYRALLDMISISDWVMNAHDDVGGHEDCQHSKLREKIMSLYKEFDAEDLVEYAPELDKHFESRDLEERMMENFIDPYESECFWDELIMRLAERDAIESVGVEKFKSLEPIERIELVSEKKSRYENEFEKYGVQNLGLTDKKQ